MSLKYGSFLLTFLISISASAGMVQTCRLEGRIVLNKATEFACFTAADFFIGPAEIITNGYPLKIQAEGSIVLDPTKGLTIRSFENNPQDQIARDAGDVQIGPANTISGKLNIQNDSHLNGCGGEVVLRALTFKNFQKPHIDVSSHGECKPGSVSIYTNAGKVPLSEFLKNE